MSGWASRARGTSPAGRLGSSGLGIAISVPSVDHRSFPGGLAPKPPSARRLAVAPGGYALTMTDQGAQHGQRIDDEMHAEVEGLVRGAPVDTRSREDLEPEPIDTMMVPVDQVDDPHHQEVLERSEIARFLRPSSLPARAAAIVAIALDEGATEAVLDELGRLPADERFSTVADIWEALGHETEHRVAAEHEPPAAEPAGTADPYDATIEAEAELQDELEDEFEAAVDEDDWHDERSARHGADALAATTVPAAPHPSRPATDDRALHPVRDVAGFAVGILRGALEAADRVLATVERRLE